MFAVGDFGQDHELEAGVDLLRITAGYSGIQSTGKSEEMELFPNPFNNELHYSFSGNGSYNKYEIYNLSGTVLKSGLTSGDAGTIDLSGLRSTGLLIIRFSGNDGGQLVQKVIRN
jgi:hypothetical protein